MDLTTAIRKSEPRICVVGCRLCGKKFKTMTNRAETLCPRCDRARMSATVDYSDRNMKNWQYLGGGGWRKKDFKQTQEV